jgi:outer membrane protein assembly factor BamA
MTKTWALALMLTCLPAAAQTQCANDNRTDKKAGILVKDFTISGTGALSSDEIARMTAHLIGDCYDDDPDDIRLEIRGLFQNRGYYAVEIKSLKLNPTDPLGIPKPVTVEATVAEGNKYSVGEIEFSGNTAFSTEKLRAQFPIRKGDAFERDKYARGADSLRNLYWANGFLDLTFSLNDEGYSNATVGIKIPITEGPQYHMGKLEILADKSLADRLRLAWQLDEGKVYDSTYINKYIEENRDLLPSGFGREQVSLAKDCPQAVVAVRLTIDDKDAASRAPMKNVPCEKKDSAEK